MGGFPKGQGGTGAPTPLPLLYEGSIVGDANQGGASAPTTHPRRSRPYTRGTRRPIVGGNLEVSLCAAGWKS